MGRPSTYTPDMVAKPSIYGLIDPRDGSIRYVGKANDPGKRLKGHLRECRRRNTPVYAWIRKLVGLGMSPGLRVLEADCEDWKEAERRIIAEMREGGRLLNVADGGDEPHCPLEVRKANAKKLNAARGSRADRKDGPLYGYWDMMRESGSILLRWRKMPGREAKAAKLAEAVSMMRAFTYQQKVDAGLKWLALHPWKVK